MYRRFLLLALVATACAPTKSAEEALSDPPPRRAEPGRPLLAIATWSAPVAGWTQWLAVYDDGLLELRSFEEAPEPSTLFARELRVRVLRVAPAELAPLKAALSDTDVEHAGSYYREDGVLDGGALTIADMATHHRRVTVVNRPSGLPSPVSTAEGVLVRLAEMAKDRGADGFAPGPDRIELIAMIERGEESIELTIFENGLLERRTTYTSSERAHAAADYPTPDAVTGQAHAGDLDALRASLSTLPAAPPNVAGAARTGDRLFVGSASREFHVPLEPSRQMLAVSSSLESLLNSLESG